MRSDSSSPTTSSGIVGGTGAVLVLVLHTHGAGPQPYTVNDESSGSACAKGADPLTDVQTHWLGAGPLLELTAVSQVPASKP